MHAYVIGHAHGTYGLDPDIPDRLLVAVLKNLKILGCESCDFGKILVLHENRNYNLARFEADLE
jgi:hypothetical protein